MFGMFSYSMIRRVIPGLCVICLSASMFAAPVFAQEPVSSSSQSSVFTPPTAFTLAQQDQQYAPPVFSERPFSVWHLAKDVMLDPTTYAPAILSYTSTRLDWDTSQVFFRNGYVEDNPRYTATGLAHDTPMGYQAGNRKILMDTLSIVGGSVANNLTDRVFERYLLERYPDHRKLVRTIGWIERTTFASYWSYRLSAAHFRQWKANERTAAQLGLQ
jgi:hypothetical protein